LLRAAYPGEAERARAFGVWGGIAGVAAASGPIVGGVLTSFVSWRAVFMVNTPIGVAVFLLTRRLVPVTSRREGGGMDPLGQAAAIVALAALVVALIEGGEAGWGDHVVVAGFATAAAAAAMFLVSERRARDPILPRDLFRSRAFTGATMVGLLLNLGFWGQLFVMSLFLQRARGLSPLETGLALLPEALFDALWSPLSGRVTGRTGPRLPITTGMVVGAAGFAGLAFVTPRTGYWLMVLPMLAAGFGIAFAMPAATAAVMSAAPVERAGLASGVLNTGRQVGGAVGVALLGSLVGAAGSYAAGMHAAMAVAAGAFVLGAGVSMKSLRS
jgi:DHA2 family methylenomycin A resistance protein-like MFS transporter